MIRDDDVAALLRAAAADIDVPGAPGQALVDAGRHRLRRRRVAAVAAGAAVVTVVAVGAPWAAERSASPRSSGRPTFAASAGCVDRVPEAVLPDWAREGFSDPEPRAAYVRSRKGDMLAIIFGQPLTAPASTDHDNKILWVPRPTSAPTSPRAGSSASDPALRIEASLERGSTRVDRVVPEGPGPSILNLPAAGCWHLTLRWAGRTDTIDLTYVPSERETRARQP